MNYHKKSIPYPRSKFKCVWYSGRKQNNPDVGGQHYQYFFPYNSSLQSKRNNTTITRLLKTAESAGYLGEKRKTANTEKTE